MLRSAFDDWTLELVRTRYLIVLPVAFAVVGAWMLNGLGVCLSQQRFLSEKEMLKAVAKAALWDYSLSIRSGYIDNAEYPGLIEYPSYDAFIVRNPACCTVVPFADMRQEEQEMVGTVSRITGRFRTFVRTSYYLTVDKKRTQNWVVSNCGKVSTSLW